MQSLLRIATAAVLLLIVAASTAQAQRPGQMPDRTFDMPRQSVTLQYGPGIAVFYSNDDISISIEDEQFRGRLRSSLATTVAYDYRITPLISLGAAVSRQSLRFSDIRADADTEERVAGTLRMSRTLVGGRVLFHYGPQGNGLDLYSGLRGGVTHWSVGGSARVGQRDIDLDRFGLGLIGGVTPQFTLIAFGFTKDIQEHIYFGAELGLGSPHMLAVQAGVRF